MVLTKLFSHTMRSWNVIEAGTKVTWAAHLHTMSHRLSYNSNVRAKWQSAKLTGMGHRH